VSVKYAISPTHRVRCVCVSLSPCNRRSQRFRVHGGDGYCGCRLPRYNRYVVVQWHVVFFRLICVDCLLIVANSVLQHAGDRATELGIKAAESIKRKTHNPNVEFIYLDLGSFKDVRFFAEQVERRTPVIDLLINSTCCHPL